MYVICTYHCRVFIQIETEWLRNKRIITCSYWFTHIFKGALFILNYVFTTMNPPFRELNAVTKLKLTLSISLLRMKLQFTKK